MKNVLVILAHPNYDQSFANKAIIERLTSKLDNYNLRNLSELYPQFNVDVKAEQEALLAADHVIFQFPFYWYSIPPILKQWIDLVLEYGFAYGENGDKLSGKTFLISTTTGTPKEAYHSGGQNGFSMTQFLQPMEQTAHLIQMPYKEPIVSHSMMSHSTEGKEVILGKANEHAAKVIASLS